MIIYILSLLCGLSVPLPASLSNFILFSYWPVSLFLNNHSNIYVCSQSVQKDYSTARLSFNLCSKSMSLNDVIQRKEKKEV